MADQSAPDIRPGANRVPWWTKVFVFFHILAITVWALPNQPEGALNGKAEARGTDKLLVWNHAVMKQWKPIQYYLFSTGFWQYWDMFSPNPSSTDMYGDAMVTFKDGTTKHYQYPRMYLLPYHERYLKERYRKFFERAHQEKYTYVWRVFARRLAVENLKDPKNPPTKIVLRRNWLPIAPPGKPQQKEYSQFAYFTYIVEKDEVLREAGFE